LFTHPFSQFDRTPAVQMAVAETGLEPVKALDALLGAIRNLSASESYTAIVGMLQEVENLKDQNTRLSHLHRELLEEYRTFRNDLESKGEEEKASIEAKLSGKEDELAQVKAEADALVTQLGEAKAEQNRLEECSNALQMEVDEARTKLIDTTASMDSKDADISRMKGQLADSEDKLSSLQKELQESKDCLEFKERELTTMGDTVFRAETAQNILKEEQSQQQSRLAELSKDLSTKQDALDELARFRQPLLSEPEDK
jgi:chromosome segregation ATPase